MRQPPSSASFLSVVHSSSSLFVAMSSGLLVGSSSPRHSSSRLSSAQQRGAVALGPSALSIASPSTPVHSAPASPGMQGLTGNTITGGSPAVPSTAKARKAVRDAEERAGKEAASEETNLQAYNAMLKKCKHTAKNIQRSDG